MHWLSISIGWKCRSWPTHFRPKIFYQSTFWLFEQCNCSLPRFLYDTQLLTISFKWLHIYMQQNNAQRQTIWA